MTDTWWVPGLLNDPEEEKRRIAAASGLLSEGQETRLYSPNPNAPTVYGAAPEPQQRSLTQAMTQPSPPPLNALWNALPPTARSAYRSLAEVLAELSPGAAVRDSVDTSRDTAEAVQHGDVWGSLGGTAGMLTAAAGVLPGGRLITKGTKELAQPIRAYHGSPHSFDRFDMSKIGTGEGAQAYGHGLYFAENEDVARGYRDTLARKFAKVNWDGSTITTPSEWSAMTRALEDSGDWRSAKLAHHYANLGGTTDYRLKQLTDWYRDQPEMMAALDRMRQRINVAPEQGKMYEVAIHADPQRFLDWDKPLSQQSRQVQDAAMSARSLLAKESYEKRGLPPSLIAEYLENYQKNSPLEATGRHIVKGFDSNGGAAQASLLMNQAGVPGIKYLDGGSRSTGEGSSNYVVFDDKLIEILRKYGLLPVAGGAVAGASALPQGEDDSR